MNLYRKNRITLASFFLLFLLNSISALAISFEHPAQEDALKNKSQAPDIVKRLNVKLPVGEKLLYAVSGDLNFDRTDDLVAVTQTKKDEANILIYFGGKGEISKPIFSSTTILGCCEGSLGFMGTPLIKNNILSLIYESSGVGAISSTEFKLRWNKKDHFNVIGYTSTGAECENAAGNCHESEKVDINFSTQKMTKGKRTCKISSESADLSLDDISESYEPPSCSKK